MVAGGEEVGRLGERGKGNEKYTLVITKQLWGCKVEHRKYSQ